MVFLSLFVNKEVDPKILTFSVLSSNTHQEKFHKNYLLETIGRQAIINQHLTATQTSIKELLQVSVSQQKIQHGMIESKLEDQNELQTQHTISLNQQIKS